MGVRRFEEPVFDRMAPLVAALTGEPLPYLDRPFAFFGHSMGAIVIFEVARRLRRAGLVSPRHLFVSGCRAPHVHDPRRPMHDLNDVELIEELRRMNGVPAEVLADARLMDLIVPAMRADLSVSETYSYSAEPALSCPITAFGGLSDPKVLIEEMTPWRDQTSVAFALHMLPGDHFFLNQAEAVGELFRTISQTLT